jgi:hypothetical protein
MWNSSPGDKPKGGSWFSDDTAARKAKAKRASAPIFGGSSKKAPKLLSWGGSGRAGTKPGLFGLGKREIDDAEQENAKSGYYGFFGARHISAKARDAKRKPRKLW